MSHHQADFSVMSYAASVCGKPTFKGGSTCLDDSGIWCFDDFGSLRVPESPEHIQASFALFTSKTSTTEPTKITLSSDLDKVLSNVDASLPWKIIVHGWRMSGQSPSMIAMKDDFFDRLGEANVIVVDWGFGADNFPNYCQSAANTRLVGKSIGILVRNMEDYFETNIAQRTHIVGFSLGGHTAGNAGMYLRRNPSKYESSNDCDKLYRITGLDAAGPAFEGQDPRLRLDATDACYVDAIHSDADKLGIKMAVGHDDFYPNGGEDQPGCEIMGNRAISRIVPGIDVGCDHFRAVEYFMESIERASTFLAFACDSFEDFKIGLCLRSSQLQKMGNDWNEQNSIYSRRDFAVTRREEPFSGEQVEITMEISKSSVECDAWFDGKDYEGHGYVYLTLSGSDGSHSGRIEMESGEYLLPDTTLYKVAILPYDMEIYSATILYAKSWHTYDDWCAAYKITVTDGTNTWSTSTKADNIMGDEEQTLLFN